MVVAKLVTGAIGCRQKWRGHRPRTMGIAADMAANASTRHSRKARSSMAGFERKQEI